MKKLFLLFVMATYCSLSFGQLSLSTPNPVISGQDFTITVAGESGSQFLFGSPYQWSSPAPVTSPTGQYVSFWSMSVGSSYSFSGQPSTFTTKIYTTSSSPVTVTFTIRCRVGNNNGYSFYDQDIPVTLTVNPVPVTYYNTAQSGSFTKNNCGTGTQGSQVTYTVPASTYSSTVSQSAANQLAINAVNANGQAHANANGQCNTLYYSVEQTGMFTRNNCLTGGTPGPAIPYTKAAGAYTSIISQQDADSKAAAALLVDGQTYANVSGTCIYPPYISGQQQVLRNTAHNYTVSNALPGDVFSWEIQQYGVSSNLATITQGQGTSAISIQTTSNFFSQHPTDFQIILTITNPNSSTRIVDYNVELHARVASNTELVGFFSVGGQNLEAWGNFNGTVTEVYIVDSSGNRIGEAHSWTGTYVGNDIDISVQITPGGTVYPFQGTCWI